jgi:putative nucleotidyltransferase with HDIG domain
MTLPVFATPADAPAETVERLLRHIGQLPSLPIVAQRALALTRHPDASMAELAEVLALDETMGSLVLCWANSAYFGLSSPVTTVQEAVVSLGRNAIQSLVMAASLAAFISQPAPGYGLECGELWKHSVGVASGARLVAIKFGQVVAEDAYHAGLLADIGKLAFEALLRNVDTTAAEWQSQSFADLEVAHFGVDHATLGAEIARRWNLPNAQVEAIACHHRPTLAHDGAVLAAAVHIADAAAMMLGIGLGRDGLQYPLDPAACERMGWTEAGFYELADKVAPLVDRTEAFLKVKH